jgi:hypothetical protein
VDTSTADPYSCIESGTANEPYPQFEVIIKQRKRDATPSRSTHVCRAEISRLLHTYNEATALRRRSICRCGDKAALWNTSTSKVFLVRVCSAVRYVHLAGLGTCCSSRSKFAVATTRCCVFTFSVMYSCRQLLGGIPTLVAQQALVVGRRVSNRVVVVTLPCYLAIVRFCFAASRGRF